MSERKNESVDEVTKLQDKLMEVIRQLTEQGEIVWSDDGNGGKDATIKVAVFEHEDVDEKGEIVRKKASVVGLMFNCHSEVREPKDPAGINEMAEIISCNESDLAKNLYDLVHGFDRKESR